MGQGDATAGAGVGAAPGLARAFPSGPVCADPCASSPSGGCPEGKRQVKLPGQVWTTAPLQRRHDGDMAEGWHRSPRLPVPSHLQASAWGDAASAWRVCWEGRTSWLPLAVLSSSHSSFSGRC